MLFERRLLRQGQFGKWLLIIASVCAIAGGVLSLFQAQFFSRIIQKVFLDQQPVEAAGGFFFWLAIVLALRAALLGGQDLAASTAAYRIKQGIREEVITHLSRVGHFRRQAESSGEVSQVLLDGIEALEPYFAQYIPQALVAFLVPPLLCLAVFLIDPLSGIVFLVTAPLIPFFMRLIGDVAERQTQRQWGRLSQLSAFLFDALQGLITIKRVGKSAEMAELLAEKGDEYRQATLETLRTTFLSALVMEMLSTLSTAVVAVQVGLRLLYGYIPFEEALFVLVIAPEFYLPLRLLGQRFHAGMNGITAWNRIVKLCELPSDAVEEPSVSREEVRQVEKIESTPEIVLQGVSFAYPEREETLKEVHATLPANQITILVGESGSGKSTLINLLLGILQPAQGQIRINGKLLKAFPLSIWWEQVGYVPQFPFLFQGTVRENLAFARPDASLLEIQRAAAMAYADEFITRLPHGYETKLGENGYGLSAGEKQRLVLARAYLKNAPLLILDESTANVDPQSLEQILRSLQEHAHGRTILIVSHQPQVWEIGQHYWVLKDGQIREYDRQAFDGLRQRENQLQEISPKSQSQEKRLEGRFEIAPSVSRQLPRVHGSEESTCLDSPFPKTGGVWKPWLLQMWSLRAWVLVAVLLGWAAILSNVGLMSTSAYIISYAALQPSIALLQTAIVGVRFFGISRGVLRYLERLASHRVTLDLLSKMRVWFYRALEPRVPQVFGRYGSGELLSRLIGDITSLEPFYVRAVAPLFVAFLVVVGMVVWWLSYPAGLIFVALGFYLVAGLFVLPIFYGLFARLTAPNNALRGEFNERLIVFLQGLSDLKVSQRLAEFQKWLFASARRYGAGILKFNGLMSLQGAAMTLLAYFGMWCVLRVASPLVHQGILSGLILAGLSLGVLVSFEAFLLLPQAVQHFVAGKEALSRLSELTAGGRPSVSGSSGSLCRLNRLEIKVEQLCFSYRALEGDYQEPGSETAAGLREISFTLCEGQRLGIVGRSGSGKTTLIHLLLGMFQPQQGSIYLDGNDLSLYDLSWWRSVVASCGQDDYLFQTTIRENLLFLNREVSEEKLWQALEAAKLADFIRQLPEGLETRLGEHGKQLSGGERQRLLLARTLLRNAPLYIFDEPTANLDLVTAQEVVRNILEWTKSRAMIIVSHQAIGFEEMDEILVLAAGEIVQRGTHEQLLRGGGYYAQLWRSSGMMAKGHQALGLRLDDPEKDD